MALHGIVLLVGQLPFFIQNILRDADLADIVEQSRLLEDFPVLVAGADGSGDGLRVVGHVLGVLERVMVLGVDGRRQGVDRGRVLEVHALVLFGQPLVRVPAADDSVRVHQNPIFAGALHVVHRAVRVGNQLV